MKGKITFPCSYVNLCVSIRCCSCRLAQSLRNVLDSGEYISICRRSSTSFSIDDAGAAQPPPQMMQVQLNFLHRWCRRSSTSLSTDNACAAQPPSPQMMQEQLDLFLHRWCRRSSTSSMMQVQLNLLLHRWCRRSSTSSTDDESI